MPTLTPEELDQAIADAGENATTLAVNVLHRDKDYVRDYIKGRKASMKPDDWEALLKHLNIRLKNGAIAQQIDLDQKQITLPVIGVIQAGSWLEAYVRDADKDTVPLAANPKYPHARQYALRVQGDSMDLIAPDGSFVHCVDFPASGLAPKPGMVVHVERQMHDLSETTLKEIGYENGSMVLIPRSSNPDYKTITPSKEETDTLIKGVVVGVYRSFD